MRAAPILRSQVAAGLVAVLAAGALLAGCTDASLTPPPAESRVQVDTPELRAAKRAAGVESCPTRATGRSDLPAIDLQCLGGGAPVTLADVAGPAVVSLWASWCVECPRELPLYQRLADRAGDRLTVLGVDYQDQYPGAGIALLDEVGATFPQLADPGGRLADHYRVRGLPGVLLVDADGKVTFEAVRIATYADLVRLVARGTGVRVD